MCGIAGIVSSDRLDGDAPARAIRMRDVIAHRGPDDARLHCDAQAALALAESIAKGRRLIDTFGG